VARQPGFHHSEETKQRMSEALRGRTPSEETKRVLSERCSGWHHCEEARQKMSASITLAMSDPERRRRISKSVRAYWASHEYSSEAKRKISEASRRSWQRPEYAKRISEANLLLWKDPEYAGKMAKACNRRPNESERQLRSVLGRHFPGEWKYTGDGTFWIEGRNPDFVNVNGRKQVIEMFGTYWHDPDLFPRGLTEEALTAHYGHCGFDCLVIWECDIWDEENVVARVQALLREEL